MIGGHPVYIIAGVDTNLGIGKDGDLPWRFKTDLKHFAKVTKKVNDSNKQNMLIMGRTTWESIPEVNRPLKGRKNVVLTRNEKYEAEGADVAISLETAYGLADDKIDNIFIIGGAQIYKQAIDRQEIDGIYLTRINSSFECDTFFPSIPPHFNSIQQINTLMEKKTRLDFLYYTRQPR